MVNDDFILYVFLRVAQVSLSEKEMERIGGLHQELLVYEIDAWQEDELNFLLFFTVKYRNLLEVVKILKQVKSYIDVRVGYVGND